MASNTHGADINELAFGFFLNNEKWFSSEAEQQFKNKKKMVSNAEVVSQMGRAKAMAEVVIAHLKKDHKGAKVKKVWWTARMGSMADAIASVKGAAKAKDIDQRKNPTDILVLTDKGDFIGYSAKSTGGKTDIGFKNPGLGTVESALNIKLAAINEAAVAKAVKTYKLPASTDARKSAIRAKAPVQAATQALGEKVLADIRDALFKKLQSLPQDALRAYILNYWMDSNSSLYPPYYKVTGFGTETFTAKLDDPLNNPKLTALKKERISLEKNGTSAIGISAGGKRILKMRAKYESEKLASSLKFSGEPF